MYLSCPQRHRRLCPQTICLLKASSQYGSLSHLGMRSPEPLPQFQVLTREFVVVTPGTRVLIQIPETKPHAVTSASPPQTALRLSQPLLGFRRSQQLRQQAGKGAPAVNRKEKVKGDPGASWRAGGSRSLGEKAQGKAPGRLGTCVSSETLTCCFSILITANWTTLTRAQGLSLIFCLL